jgi:hypothetical protein
MYIMSNSLGKLSAAYENVFSPLKSTLRKTLAAAWNVFHKKFIVKKRQECRSYEFLNLIAPVKFQIPMNKDVNV